MADREAKPSPPPPVGVSDSYARGLRLFMQGRYERAMAVLKPLSKRDDLPGQMAKFYRGLCRRELGVRALNDGRYAEAEKHLRDALSLLGRRGDLYEFLATACARTNRYEASADACEKAVECGSRRASQLQRRRAQALWQAGRRVDAHMVLAEALRHDGGSSELLMQAGLFDAAEERYDRACDAFTKAVELDGSNPQLHYYLGLSAAAAGDLPKAIRSLQRTLELRSEDILAAYQLALAARTAREAGVEVSIRVPEPARASSQARSSELVRYVAEEPDFVEAFLALPESDADGQLFALLAEVLQTALTEHPRYADLHRNAARVLERLGRHEEAVAHARRAVEINPGYLAARLDLARLLQRSGQCDEALEHLEQVVSGGGDWPDVHCQAARLLRDRRETDRARRHLQRALELNPDYREASEELHDLAA
ncbi:MAG: tetratricopeptide repeat protein [Phycisphaerae bacterium]